MRKSLRYWATGLMAGIISIAAFAQTVTIRGTVRNSTTKQPVPAVSVTVKGAADGTFTDDNGNFAITTSAKLPLVLIVSSINFETKEVTIDNPAGTFEIDLVPTSSLGQEVVISATRSAQRALDAPVTVERLGGASLRAVAAPNYYEALTNLKGVDMHTASLTFRTITTRGFVSSGNTRLNQLIDGMDNQAPGLNFSVGNIVGLTELDVDNIELLAGASSALYGSGGMNGTLLISSKNPFKYQGLSYNIKQGIMHTDGKQRDISPYYDWSMRWAKNFNDKIAFKISAQMLYAKDWQADDDDNVSRTSVLSTVKPGNRKTDPNYDGINVYGDETSANIRDIALLLWDASGRPANFPGTSVPASYFTNPSNFASQLVSRTGYQEKDLVDYNTINFKFTGGIHYKITPAIEASWNTYWGTGTTVYTGADRYSLRNFKIAQHKAEVRHKNWFVRAYTTQENAGQSYNATVLGRLINEVWKPSLNSSSPATVAASWYPQYIGAYLTYKYNLFVAGVPADDYNAHNFARGIADAGRFVPGTPQFENAKKSVKSLPIPRGALFLDRSDLWVGEGQFNLSDVFGFSDKVEIITGVGYRQNVLNSQGTIFADTAGKINISEFGGYIQLKRKFFDVLTLTAAGRYDKHENFEGRFTPRFTGVLNFAKDNNLRVSYQTAYRFPTNQNQYINLNVGSGILIGSIPEFQDYYNLDNNPGYTAESIIAARAAANPAALVEAVYKKIKPETVVSTEIGYKGIIGRKMLVDFYVYFSKYNDFIGTVAVGQSLTGSPTGVLNPFTTRNLSYNQNSDAEVKATGWGLGIEYQLPRGFLLSGNVYSDRLKDVPPGYVTFFNAPKYRVNLGLRNENVFKNVGFNVILKWQDETYYEGTFVTGTLPSFLWAEAQFTYKVPNSKGIIKIGATNLANSYFRTGYGSPAVGGLYYVSYGYNIF